VAIFRKVLLKDVLHRMSNNCLIFNVIVLWPSSGRWYLRIYYIEHQTTVLYLM